MIIYSEKSVTYISDCPSYETFFFYSKLILRACQSFDHPLNGLWLVSLVSIIFVEASGSKTKVPASELIHQPMMAYLWEQKDQIIFESVLAET